MSSTYFPVLAVSALDLSALAASGLSPSARLTLIAKPSFSNTGLPFLSARTLPSSTEEACISESMLSAADSPARTLAPLERELELPGVGVDSGHTLPGLLAKFDPATSSWKTSQCSFLADLDEFSETWPRSGMMRNGTAYPLGTSAFPMKESGYSLLPTPRKSRGYTAYSTEGYAPSLTEYLTGKTGRENNGLKPDPCFVELMMGYPMHHTELNASEIQSLRKSRKSSAKPS